MKPPATLLVAGRWKRLKFQPTSPLPALLTAPEIGAVAGRLARFRTQASGRGIPLQSGPEGGRFVAPNGPGALYLGSDLDTCLAEVAHHHARRCADSGAPAGTRAIFTILVFDVRGRLADATKGPRSAALHDRDTWAPSWSFGQEIREAGLPGVFYQSVRHPGGHCLAVFQEGVARFKAEQRAVVIEWTGVTSVQIGR